MGSWETAKLGEVCQMIKRGVTPKYVEAGGMPVINQKCIRNHLVNFSLARRHNPLAKPVDKERHIQVGDVLVNSTGTGTLGRLAQVRELPQQSATVDTHVTIVRPLPGKFYPDFFGYMLTTIEEDIASSGEGASGQTELSRSTLEQKFKVCFPRSLEEQKRIVAILDEAFEGIAAAVANAEKNLANARELFESYLNSVFTRKGEGWVESALGDLIEIKHGFAFKSEFFKSAGKYVLLTPGNFYEEGGYRDRGEKQKFYVGEIPRDFILRKDDFLIAMTEQAAGLLGSSMIVPQEDKFLHNQRLGLVIVKPTTCWCNEFFFHAFNTKKFRKAVHDDASGVKVRHTSPKKLGRLMISYPPSLSEQERIAASLDDVLLKSKSLETIYRQKLENFGQLKQSILQKAFSGELTSKLERTLKEALG
ncbi:MAG: restriction endonuclease subunit S [Gammaproteobacteria bacterium]